MDTDLERLEKTVSAVVVSVSTLTQNLLTLTRDTAASREDVSKLHEAIRLVNADVEKHGTTLQRMEIDAAREEGRKSAMGDLQTKLREHDEAAREIVNLRQKTLDLSDVVGTLKVAHDKQRGFLVAAGIVGPILTTLLTAYVAKMLGLAG